MTTTTDIQLHSGNGQAQVIETPASAGRAALTPNNYAEMFRLAEAMHKSAMFGVKNPEQAMVVLMTGLELGFSPAQAFRGIHVINNKPTLSADMMVAVCKSRPDLCLFFRMVESSDDRATYETHRRGEPEPVSITFTAADAKRAGLTTNPTWQKFPSQMCRARAASGLARAVYPDLILGLYTPDEAEAVAPTPADAFVPPPNPPGAAPSRATQAPAQAERSAPPREAPPARPVPANGAPNATAACAGCGKALTGAQATISLRNYGEALCPGCQKDRGQARGASGAPAPAHDSFPAEEAERNRPREVEDDPFADQADMRAALTPDDRGPGHGD